MHNFCIILRFTVGYIYIFTMLFFITRYKCSQKKAAITITFVCLGTIFLNIAILSVLNYKKMPEVSTVLICINTIVTLLIIAKDKLLLILFNLFSVIHIFYIVSIISKIFAIICNANLWLELVYQILLFTAIVIFYLRFLMKPYRFLAKNMRNDWWVISFTPFFYFIFINLLVAYLIKHDNLFLILVLSYVILCFVYYVIYQVFQNTYLLLMKQQSEKVLSNHLVIMGNQFEVQKKYLEQVRILRHDMKHFAQNISILLKEKNIEAALQFIGKFEDLYNLTALPKYCVHPLINCILSFYIEKAKQENIEVKAQLDIPEALPVDPIELSILFANAIENASNACHSLPPSHKKCIEIYCVSHPQFALEISNTCLPHGVKPYENTELDYDSKHGIGSLSIAAFVKKYGILLNCKMEHGKFRLRMVMPPS